MTGFQIEQILFIDGKQIFVCSKDGEVFITEHKDGEYIKPDSKTCNEILKIL